MCPGRLGRLPERRAHRWQRHGDLPSTRAGTPRQGTGGDSDLVAAQLAAWNAKDADAFAATYAADARFFDPIGNLYPGRQGIRDAHAFLFAGPFAPSSETQVITEIRILTGTLALVHLEAALTGYAGLPPGLSATEPGVLRTTKTWVVEKRSGEWLILIQHMAPVVPAQNPVTRSIP